MDESRAIESVELRLVVGRLSRGDFLRGLDRLAATAADTITSREVRRGVFSSTFGVTVRAPKPELLVRWPTRFRTRAARAQP